MTSPTLISDVPGRAMAVGAHPDDAELGAGATLAKWAALGCEVTIVVCTDGAAGAPERGACPEVVAATRRDEQQAAAVRLGARHVEMLAHPDGGLQDSREFLAQLVALIRRYRPDTVLTHDARRYRRLVHRDHRVAGAAVEDAVFPFARDRLHFAEHLEQGLKPHKVRRVLLWDTDEANSIVDVTGYVETQAAALAEHRSQLAGLGLGENLEESLLTLSQQRAAVQGYECAEVFRMLTAPI